MEDRTRTIRIESILGGLSDFQYFAAPDQYMGGVSIDPMKTEGSSGVSRPSGILRPIPSQEFAKGTLNHAPLWLIPNPKDENVYVYAYSGSTYTLSFDANAAGTFTGLGDLNDGGTSAANGAAYYDNYIYFARDTTIARYGPLNGTPSFTDDYWVATLGKTALENTSYPLESSTALIELPNHTMLRHSDGKLYVSDVVGGQATLHYIKTTKTTVEGDTDNGSTYNALNYGYNLKPTAIASYGDFIVVALYDGQGGVGMTNPRGAPAKIIFWDGVSASPNNIIWDFPDPLITAMVVYNGVLYFVSSNVTTDGTRISRYIGGKSFEEIFYSPLMNAPLAGGLIGAANRLFWGGAVMSNLDTSLSSAVYAMNVGKSNPGAVHCIMAAQDYGGGITMSLAFFQTSSEGGTGVGLRLANMYPLAGYSNGVSGTTSSGIFGLGTTLQASGGSTNRDPVWWSQTYRIGQPFKIKKIRIPLSNTLTTNNEIRVSLFFDGQDDNVLTLTSASNSNYSGKKSLIFRPESATGEHSFWLQIEWIGTAPISVALPITIEYELIDD